MTTLRTATPRMQAVLDNTNYGAYWQSSSGFDPYLQGNRGTAAIFTATAKTTMSFWVAAPKDSTYTHSTFFGQDASRGDDTFKVRLVNNTLIFDFWRFPGSAYETGTTTARLVPGTWNHVLYTADHASTGSRQIWVNGVKDTATWSLYSIGYTYNWNASELFRIGLSQTNASGDDWGVAQFWMSPEWMDFNVEANRLKFVNSDGSLKWFGKTGTVPTGVQPPIYWEGWQGGKYSNGARLSYKNIGGYGFNKFSGGSRMEYILRATPGPKIGLSYNFEGL